MKIFLKAKHWQIFLVNFALPMVIQIYITLRMVTTIIAQHATDPSVFFDYVRYIPLVIIPSMVTIYGWYWAVAVDLMNKLPEHLKLNNLNFKLFFFLQIVYMIFFVFFSLKMMSSFFYSESIPDFRMLFIIMPLHFIAIFFAFYCMFFVAKIMKTVELQRKVVFSDYVTELLLILIFPIGIWFIQPTINRLVSRSTVYPPEIR